jgi:hypothetical protein
MNAPSAIYSSRGDLRDESRRFDVIEEADICFGFLKHFLFSALDRTSRCLTSKDVD